MHPHIRTLWADALRSGFYVQGYGTLRSIDDKFCCLGVLCDLHSRASGERWKRSYLTNPKHEYMGCTEDLPDAVMHWAGLRDHNPYLKNKYTGELERITNVSDLKIPFIQLAEAIERCL